MINLLNVFKYFKKPELTDKEKITVYDQVLRDLTAVHEESTEHMQGMVDYWEALTERMASKWPPDWPPTEDLVFLREMVEGVFSKHREALDLFIEYHREMQERILRRHEKKNK